MKRIIRQLGRWTGFGLLALAILLIGAWCALALWFRFPAGAILRDLIAGAAFVLAVATVASLFAAWRWRALAGYAVLVAILLAWWSTIQPSNDRDWAPEFARVATATIEGDRLVLDNVRNFTWRSDTDFDQRWERRTYDLSQVASVDLIMSYWGSEAIAHTIISFGFDNGSWLAFSIEIRRQRGQAWSALAGFFKEYELALIAADERDIVRVRSNIRDEDVRIFRLRMTPANARKLLLEYAAELNELARRPRFYNTLTANCTTLVFAMVRAIHPGLPLDPRILLSGFLPDYAYDVGALDTTMPFTELRELARIRERALRAGDDPDFSAKIRVGLPLPR